MLNKQRAPKNLLKAWGNRTIGLSTLNKVQGQDLPTTSTLDIRQTMTFQTQNTRGQIIMPITKARSIKPIPKTRGTRVPLLAKVSSAREIIKSNTKIIQRQIKRLLAKIKRSILSLQGKSSMKFRHHIWATIRIGRSQPCKSSTSILMCKKSKSKRN